MRIKSAKPIAFMLIVLLMGIFLLFDNIEDKTKQIHTSLEVLDELTPSYYQNLHGYLETQTKLDQDKVSQVLESLKVLEEMDLNDSLHSQEQLDEYSKAFNDYQLKLNHLWESIALDSQLLTNLDERKSLYDIFKKSQNYHQEIDHLRAKLINYNDWLSERKYSIINKLFHDRTMGPTLTIETYPIQLTFLKWPKPNENELTEQ